MTKKENITNYNYSVVLIFIELQQINHKVQVQISFFLPLFSKQKQKVIKGA